MQIINILGWKEGTCLHCRLHTHRLEKSHRICGFVWTGVEARIKFGNLERIWTGRTDKALKIIFFAWVFENLSDYKLNGCTWRDYRTDEDILSKLKINSVLKNEYYINKWMQYFRRMDWDKLPHLLWNIDRVGNEVNDDPSNGFSTLKRTGTGHGA